MKTTKTGTLPLRRANERGQADHGWLQSRHTFSFAGYYDVNHMGFRTLRVINDDIVAGGQGFGTHPHNDMEIITYVVSGALEHKDSMGNGSIIRPDDVQRMTAGTGVEHSEFNPKKDTPVRLLQIWIFPERKGLTPGYEQKTFPREEKRNRLRLIASRNGEDGSVTIHQDARIYAAILTPETRIHQEVSPDRHFWLQVVNGALEANGVTLETGDGLAIEQAEEIVLTGSTEAEVLLFDLA